VEVASGKKIHSRYHTYLVFFRNISDRKKSSKANLNMLSLAASETTTIIMLIHKENNLNLTMPI
jgi:hypothetical protein